MRDSDFGYRELTSGAGHNVVRTRTPCRATLPLTAKTDEFNKFRSAAPYLSRSKATRVRTHVCSAQFHALLTCRPRCHSLDWICRDRNSRESARFRLLHRACLDAADHSAPRQAQNFQIYFDTGSSDFTVASTTCGTSCGSKNRYNVAGSSTANKTSTTVTTNFVDGTSSSGSVADRQVPTLDGREGSDITA